MSEIEKPEEISASLQREFDQEERIGVFRDTILNTYQEISEEYIAYRTVTSYPLSPDDQLPLIVRREKEGIQKAKKKYSVDEVAKMTESKIRIEIGHYALSINDTAENCESSAIKHYQNLKDKGATEEELQAYIDQRGEYIAKLSLTKEAGLITEFNEKGHANFLLYSDVILEEYRDKTYYHKIDYRGASGKQ